MDRSKLKVGQALKRRIEYGALNLAHYPSVSSWCRAVALQAIQAQGAGRAHAPAPQPGAWEKPRTKRFGSISVRPRSSRLRWPAGGPGAIGPWLRGWVVWELDRLEAGERDAIDVPLATVGYARAG